MLNADLLYGMRYWLDLSSAMQSMVYGMPCVVTISWIRAAADSIDQKPPYPRHSDTAWFISQK